MRYRKKPIVVEAFRFNGDLTMAGLELWPAWARNGDLVAEQPQTYDITKNTVDKGPVSLLVKTIEGSVKAEVGDWIIKGVTNELYPCKHHIFEQTYERVEE